MLLLATQLSHESKMKTLLLTTLEALLHTLKSRETADVVTEAMTVIRCIIRLVQSLLAEPTAKKFFCRLLSEHPRLIACSQIRSNYSIEQAFPYQYGYRYPRPEITF